MTKVLISAPYMLPTVERFRPVFESFGLEMAVARVNERLEEEDLLGSLAYVASLRGANHEIAGAIVCQTNIHLRPSFGAHRRNSGRSGFALQ